MRFMDGLGRYMSNGRGCFHNEDESYRDIKCYNVCFSENDRNYIEISFDEQAVEDLSFLR